MHALSYDLLVHGAACHLFGPCYLSLGEARTCRHDTPVSTSISYSIPFAIGPTVECNRTLRADNGAYLPLLQAAV
jgi:hypothetical protein